MTGSSSNLPSTRLSPGRGFASSACQPVPKPHRFLSSGSDGITAEHGLIVISANLPSSRIGAAGDIDRLGVLLGIKGPPRDAVQAVAVNVQALQANLLQRSQNLGFWEMALAVDRCLASIDTRPL